MISYTEYAGWKRNVRLSNGTIELVATLEVGPRILRFAFADGPNMFKEYAEQLGATGESEWLNRGGHRLWHAPEAKPRTYVPDNSPVQCEEISEMSICLTPAPETTNGIQKQIEVCMATDANEVTVTHRLTNIGPWSITLAPWALTVMAPGGKAILPLPEKRPHTEVLTPDFPLVLWPYTDMSDARFQWGKRYFTMAQDAAKGPTKFGMAAQLGWAAYHLQNTLFVKYFDYIPEIMYPDYGCNFESFTDQNMLEVESLGPITLLEPGETVDHVETWRLFANVPAVSDDASIDATIRPLIGV